MGNTQNIRSRIKSIESTQKITQSMRLVSSSKIRKAQHHMQGAEPFYKEALALVEQLIAGLPKYKHPYLQQREVKSSGVVAMSSDRGLCGSYNMNIVKKTTELVSQLEQYKLIGAGTQLWDRLRRNNIFVEHGFHGISETPYFEDAQDISDILLAWYDTGEVDAIYMVYTEFVSMLEQQPVVVKLLPLAPCSEGEEIRQQMTCEPNEDKILSTVIPLYLTAYIYHGMTSSAVSEQSARINSMDTATRNSDELIDTLNLEYNKARQGAITMELIEIVAGANAVE